MGRVLRWTTAGESHGRALVAVVEGMVAGVHVTSTDIADQLARRRLGYGRGARMKFEQDQVTMLAGVRHGSTLGGPIAIEIGNSEWPKWDVVMAADPVATDALDVARNAPLTRPRPGHADYAGMLKYGFDDARPVLERASARETAARVAAGTVARAFLKQALGVDVVSHVISIGASEPYNGPVPRAADLEAIDDTDTPERGAFVDSLRSDDTLSKRIITVDNVDEPFGRLAVVLALSKLPTLTSGSYGIAASADAPSFFPTTMPAAIASTFFAAPPISTPRTSVEP